MSKLICSSAIDGAVRWVARAEASAGRAPSKRRARASGRLPHTAYYLPIIYSFTGEKVETLGRLRRILKRAKELLPERPAEEIWLPYLGSALDAGVAALFACEIIEACKYLIGPDPVDGIWLGAATDMIMRERGIEFVDGTAPGFAAVTGAAPANEIAVQIARELQEKNLYVFMAGYTDGRQFAEQLAEEGVQLGWETRLVPFGRDVSASSTPWASPTGRPSPSAASSPATTTPTSSTTRTASSPSSWPSARWTPRSTRRRPAPSTTAFPSSPTPTSRRSCRPASAPTSTSSPTCPHETMVEKALEVRGCKVRITKVPIPVPYGPAFEGERIRKADVHVEFGGNNTPAFEFVTTVELDEIDDGEIEIIGPDIDAVEEGTALPLAIWVEVAGRKMQADFEPILERQIHHLLNGAEGIWHMGQRDIVWTRVSKEGFEKGLRLEHYGKILHAKLLSEYPAIVDKVKVTLITEADEVERRMAVARAVYDERNRRLETMTDESVDTFYSCLLCQSFAPEPRLHHHPRAAGAVRRLQLARRQGGLRDRRDRPQPAGCQGRVPRSGQGRLAGVNDYVYTNSHRRSRRSAPTPSWTGP